MSEDVVIIRRYSNPDEAYIDAGMLSANGIDCEVDGGSVSTLLPYLQNSVSLLVRQEDAESAVKLLSDGSKEQE